jgi:hypothetical protein
MPTKVRPGQQELRLEAGDITMALVMIKCPNTRRDIFVGIEIEEDAFHKLPEVRAETKCPACGAMHPWSKKDAWLSDGRSQAPNENQPDG